MNEENSSHFPHYPRRKIHNLQGIWDFAFLEDPGDPRNLKPSEIRFAHRMPVPSAFDAFPKFAGKRGVGVYRTTVKITPETLGLMKFGATGIWAAIFVDDNLVKVNQLPYSGFDLEVPPSEDEVREVVVVVDNRFDENRSPLQQSYFDFYAYGGIFRSVEWHEVPELYIKRAQVETVDIESGEIRVTLHLEGENIPENGNLTISVDNGDPREIDDVEVTDGTITFSGSLKKSERWTPSSPALHQIRVSCGEDTIVERFGLRTIEVRNGKILLNGKPIKLLGFCRHEAHPAYGPALPVAQLVQDMQILKDLGCNFVRGAHYPQDQRFLDLCDEMGLMVFEESLGWQPREDHFQDPNFCSLCEEQTRQMVRNSINHPSVIIWGFLNEGESHRPGSRDLYRRLTNLIREEDKSRLVSYATNRPYEDINLDLVDLISINAYPGWYTGEDTDTRPLDDIARDLNKLTEFLDDRGYAAKPIIISEIGAGAIPGWHDPLQGRWTEEFQEHYLDVACSEITGSKRLSGVSLWQLFDCRTYAGKGSLNRPRGFNNKGIMDEYRRPKRAYQTVRRIFRNHWRGSSGGDGEDAG